MDSSLPKRFCATKSASDALVAHAMNADMYGKFLKNVDINDMIITCGEDASVGSLNECNLVDVLHNCVKSCLHADAFERDSMERHGVMIFRFLFFAVFFSVVL